MGQNQLTLAEQAEQIEAEAAAVAQMSIFNQPSAIKAMLPGITGLIKQLCSQVDMQKGEIFALLKTVAEQQAQIKRLTGGY